jgi:uncharacterized protein YaaW (UPF0174 family)
MSEQVKNQPEVESFEKQLNSIVKNYALNAVWIKSYAELQNHLMEMNAEIASKCNKSPKNLTLDDLQRLFASFHNLSEKLKINNLDFSKVEQLYLKYQVASPYLDVASLIYSIANAVKGNPGPILRKLFIKSTNKINAQYIATTYIVGQCSIILYKQDVNISELQEIEQCPIDAYDPLFKLLKDEHIKDLAKLLKIKVDINTPIDEARVQIINELNYTANNKVKYLFNKTWGDNKYTYRALLLSICAELKIESVEKIETEELEQKIVMKFLQDTVEKLSEKEKKELEEKLMSLDDSVVNKELLASSGLMATIVGLNATGFGAYMAASSALGALSHGLGITFAFSTYTTMSSVLAGLLGPIGIGTAAIAILASISQSQPKKVLPAVIYIAMLRNQLKAKELVEPVKKFPWKFIIIPALITIISSVSLLYYFLQK